MAQLVKASDLLNMAALLLSVDNENKEYDRAIVELVGDTLGFGVEEEDRANVEKMLRALQH